MNYLLLVMVFTGFFCFSVGLYAFKRKKEKSALPFAALMVACGIHALGYGFELYIKDASLVLLWVNVEYIGIAFFPFILVWLTYTQKNDESFLNSLVLIAFFSVSIMTFFLVQTNPLHALYYKTIEVDTKARVTQVVFSPGIWYHVHSFFVLLSYGIVAINTLYRYLNAKAFYKKRVFNTMLLLLMPLLASLIYVLGWTPMQLDILPFVYGPIGLVWLLGVNKYGIVDLVPVTYKKIFEQISEGVLVLDDHNAIINFNMAAYKIFKPIEDIAIGLDFQDVLSQVDFKSTEEKGEIFEVAYKNKVLVYHLKKSFLQKKGNKNVGKVLVINDITKEAEATRVLTTLATQDALTGIHNRRHFFALCDQKIQRAKTLGKKISFILMDIDYFKQVNDNYGHLTGDKILQEIARICQSSLRESDLIGRYGGEEFACLIYDSGIQVTHSIIERMRLKINDHKFYINDHDFIHLTVSFGIYRPDLTQEEDIQGIFKKADIGLYQAKSDGRDRIVFHSEYIS